MFTIDDARRYLLGLLPPGHDNFYDESASGDMYLLFDGIGALFKTYAFDLLDTLRAEVFPSTAQQKIPDWEGALGIANQAPALFGNTSQRQQAVLAKLREFGPFCDPVVQSVIAPLLGYFPSTPLRLIKCDRSALTLMHSYDFTAGADVAIPVGTTTRSVVVIDGGKVAKMGAQLTLVFAANDTSLFSFTLTGPDGTSKTWAAGSSNAPLWLTAIEFAGAKIQGIWRLSITNASGAPTTLYSAAPLVVEGIGAGQQTGGAVFDWGIYVDPAHAAESGVPVDLVSARAAIARIKHSHTVGNLIRSLAPMPDVDSGVNASIPDECIPT
jgi:hypothetical protein